MPLAQADPFGGVIITDWYSPPETPDERFKLTVYILDPVLRADGVKVAVFRQTDGENGWADARSTRRPPPDRGQHPDPCARAADRRARCRPRGSAALPAGGAAGRAAPRRSPPVVLNERPGVTRR